MRTKCLLLSVVAIIGLGLSTGCRDNDCEVRTTRVYYDPAPPPPAYQFRGYFPRRNVDVRVFRNGHHRDRVRVNVNRYCD